MIRAIHLAFNCVLLFKIFVFFQAEEGIRDSSVTGVQMCALPISGTQTPDLTSILLRDRPPARRCEDLDTSRQHEDRIGSAASYMERHSFCRGVLLSKIIRSEERRVGKECNSGIGS